MLLSMLARKFGLNKSYISNLIGKTTLQNFRAYLNGYRLKKAKELLKNTEKTLRISVLNVDTTISEPSTGCLWKQ